MGVCEIALSTSWGNYCERERERERHRERVHIERHRDTEREGQGETQRGNWGEILWERECADCQRERERERGRDTERDTERESTCRKGAAHTYKFFRRDTPRKRQRKGVRDR